MLPKGNLLNFLENLKGEGRATLALEILAENRYSGGFRFWPKQKPAASGGVWKATSVLLPSTSVFLLAHVPLQ
jgi:hypothetical protein